jgi:hypothetical protein
MKSHLLPTLLTSIAMFWALTFNAQSLVWASAFLGVADINMHATVPDDAGNVYSTGSFDGTVDFDPGPGEYNVSSVGVNADIFITKINASGNLLWVQIFGSSADGQERGLSLALDVSGNLYACGMFLGNVDFDPGEGVQLLSGGSVREGFVLKL